MREMTDLDQLSRTHYCDWGTFEIHYRMNGAVHFDFLSQFYSARAIPLRSRHK